MLSLFTIAVLAAALPNDETVVVVQLARGQELVYRGKCEAVAQGSSRTSRQQWDLGVRIFVLDTADDKATVAICGTMRQPGPTEQENARLVLADVSYLGRVRSQGEACAVPFDRPALVDPLAFLEVPARPLTVDSRWEVNEPGQPPRFWKMTSFENCKAGTRCLKLCGEQATPGWDKLGTHREWRRQDWAWLDPRSGIVRQLDRTIEVRDPTAKETTCRLVTHFELEGTVTYPDRLGSERRAEIMAAWQAEQAAKEFALGKLTPRQLAIAQRRVEIHLRDQAATVYRDGVLGAVKKLDAARRGELTPPPTTAPTVNLAVGEPAPTLVAPDLFTGYPKRFGGTHERPTVLVFFRPDSSSAVAALCEAGCLAPNVAVAGLCVSEDTAAAMQIIREHKLDVPLFDGRDAERQLGGSSTPRFVVLDESGIVRLIVDGYGSEVGALLAKATGYVRQAERVSKSVHAVTDAPKVNGQSGH
ncbi:MAG: TlpA family protein disulfide reductase [Gemmataceae bacterium]